MNIAFKNVSYHYPSGNFENTRQALTNISLSIEQGDNIALIGRSGAGKTTLAQLFNGLLRPTSGQILVDGSRLTYDHQELQELRRRVGLIFQFPEAQIFQAEVFSEVAFAAEQRKYDDAVIHEAVRAALGKVGLDFEEFSHRHPLKLSGGEARLVSIASLLVIDPEWLILDEPTLGLDIAHRERIRSLLIERSNEGKGVVLISHDFDLIWETCSRAIVLSEGAIVYDGLTSKLLNNRNLCDQYALIQPEVVKLTEAIEEELPDASVRFDDQPVSQARLLTWIQSQPEPVQDLICSILKQISTEQIKKYHPHH